MRFILLGLVAFAACHNEHHIEVSWAIAQYAPGLDGGYPISCPQGWDLARVVAIDPAHPDAPHVESFPCSDGFDVTDYLPADSYVGHIEITTTDAKVLVASPPEVVDVTPFDPYLNATFFIDAGYVDVDWAPCGSGAPADDAVLTIAPIAPSKVDFDEADTFMPCTEGHLQAGPYPVGMYTPGFGLGSDVVQLPPVAVEALKVTHLGLQP